MVKGVGAGSAMPPWHCQNLSPRRFARNRRLVFAAECSYKPADLRAFGTFIERAFGTTGSIDPGRRLC